MFQGFNFLTPAVFRFATRDLQKQGRRQCSEGVRIPPRYNGDQLLHAKQKKASLL